MKVSDNLATIQQNIIQACEKSKRNADDVKIIAVTKYVSSERTKEAIDAGIMHIGENRLEGLLQKQSDLEGAHPIWHFIGSLQTRKVKDIIDHVDYIHSLDRLSLAKEIQKRANRPISCFIQVNASGEETKHGLAPEKVVPFIQEINDENFDKIRVAGLMTMAPYTEDQKILRDCFKIMRELQQDIINLQFPFAPCTELSMGMSNDYEIAIDEGATFIRIGTALVGEDS